MKSWLWVVTALENACGTHWVLFICIAFIVSIRWKLFQSLKNYVGHFLLPFKCLFFLILEKKLTLSNQIFRKWGWDSVNFFIWDFSIVGIEESCFKAPKVLLDECFYNWNVHFFLVLERKLTLSDPIFRRWVWHCHTSIHDCHMVFVKLYLVKTSHCYSFNYLRKTIKSVFYWGELLFEITHNVFFNIFILLQPLVAKIYQNQLLKIFISMYDHVPFSQYMFCKPNPNSTQINARTVG